MENAYWNEKQVVQVDREIAMLLNQLKQLKEVNTRYHPSRMEAEISSCEREIKNLKDRKAGALAEIAEQQIKESHSGKGIGMTIPAIGGMVVGMLAMTIAAQMGAEGGEAGKIWLIGAGIGFLVTYLLGKKLKSKADSKQAEEKAEKERKECNAFYDGKLAPLQEKCENLKKELTAWNSASQKKQDVMAQIQTLFSRQLSMAQAGNKEAQLQAGWWYDRIVDEKNATEAMKWYEKASLDGNGIALYLMGCNYASSYAGKYNPADAATCFVNAADLGIKPACCAAGLCYKYGFGIKKDYDKAVRYLKAALDWNYKEQDGDWCSIYDGFIARSLFHLADCYENGWGCEVDARSAAALYAEAAKHGYVYAVHRMNGIKTQNRWIQQQDEKLEICRKWLVTHKTAEEIEETARATNNSRAWYALAEYYYARRNDEMTRVSAYNAEKGGCIFAHIIRGQHYLSRAETPDDTWRKSAVREFEAASYKGCVEGDEWLAKIYTSGLEGYDPSTNRFGQIIKPDVEKAFYYRKRAAEGGNIERQKAVAESFERGRSGGVEGSYLDAEYWNTRAFEQIDQVRMRDYMQGYINICECALAHVLSNDISRQLATKAGV